MGMRVKSTLLSVLTYFGSFRGSLLFSFSGKGVQFYVILFFRVSPFVPLIVPLCFSQTVNPLIFEFFALFSPLLDQLVPDPKSKKTNN